MINSGTIEVIAASVLTERGLLTVRKRNTSRFMLPGGKPDPGEDDVSCLSRELQEELSAAFDKYSTRFLGSFTAEAANEHGSMVTARVYRVTLVSSVEAGAEIEQIAWVKPDDIAGIELAPLLRDHLARISHTNRRIGAPNQRKLLCCNDFTQVRGAPDADRVYHAIA